MYAGLTAVPLGWMEHTVDLHGMHQVDFVSFLLNIVHVNCNIQTAVDVLLCFSLLISV